MVITRLIIYNNPPGRWQVFWKGDVIIYRFHLWGDLTYQVPQVHMYYLEM